MRGWRRVFASALLGVIGAGSTAILLHATDGPLTPLMTLRGRTDENGYLRIVAGTPGLTDGPLTPLSALRGRTDENGYLIVSCSGCGGGGSTGVIPIYATGTLTRSTNTNPANNATIVVGSTTYTFKSSMTGADNEIHLGGNGTLTFKYLAAAIANDTSIGGAPGDWKVAAANSDASVSFADPVITLRARTVGTAGNSVPISSSTIRIVASATTLSGGAAATFITQVAATDGWFDTSLFAGTFTGTTAIFSAATATSATFTTLHSRQGNQSIDQPNIDTFIVDTSSNNSIPAVGYDIGNPVSGAAVESMWLSPSGTWTKGSNPPAFALFANVGASQSIDTSANTDNTKQIADFSVIGANNYIATGAGYAGVAIAGNANNLVTSACTDNLSGIVILGYGNQTDGAATCAFTTGNIVLVGLNNLTAYDSTAVFGVGITPTGANQAWYGNPASAVLFTSSSAGFSFDHAISAPVLAGSGSGVSVADVGAASCGTSAAAISGTQVSGVIVVGATAGAQCRVTFTTAAPSRRDCTVTDSTTTIATRATYVDTTHTDFLGAFVAGDSVTYVCTVR